MDRQRAGARDLGNAGVIGIGVALAADHQIGAIGADARDLGRRRHRRHEDLRRHAAAHRGVGDRGAVVAARRRDHAGRRHRAGQQIGEGTARLERARMLQLLELEGQCCAPKTEILPEIGAVELDHGRAPDIRPDHALGRGDVVAINLGLGHARSLILAARS